MFHLWRVEHKHIAKPPKDLQQKIHRQQWAHHYARTPKRKYGQTKSRCKIFKEQFLISIEEFLGLCSRPCYYCNQYLGDTGCGLDRVDNTIGYMITNVVPCCSRCNRMKANLTLEIFLQKITQVYKTMVYKGLIQSDK